MLEKEKKKHISPKTPEDLWTCSSYLARDLVFQYLRLGMLNQTDAVALYIAAGVLEFGRKQKPFYDPPGTIARSLGLPKSSVKTYIDRHIENGIIARTGMVKDPLKKRIWSIPSLPPPNNASAVSSVHNSTLETENMDGGHNTYHEGDTPSSLGEGTSCNPGEGTSCGLHLKESYKEKSKEVKQIGKEGEKTPSCISRDSSFKKRSEAEIQLLVDSFPWNDHQLDTPEGLASFWAHLIGIWKSPSRAKAKRDSGSAGEIDIMEVRRAYMTLKQMRIYKNPETVRLWLEWYIKSGGLDKAPFITWFSKSWKDYIPIAARAFVDKLKEEEEAWGAEVSAKYQGEAWAERNRADQALGEIDKEQLQRMRESFHKTLPSIDAIRESVEAVPIDVDLYNDGDYMKWLKSLARAVPVLGDFIEIDDLGRHSDFVRLAREDCEGDLEWFAKVTRDYVVDRAEYFIEILKSEGYTGLRILMFTWRMYSNYFDLAPGALEAQGFTQDGEGDTDATVDHEDE